MDIDRKPRHFGVAERIGCLIAGSPFIAVGVWIAWIVHRFLDGRGWFELGVRLVLDEIAAATITIGVVVAVRAVLTEDWGDELLRWLAQKLHLFAIAIFSLLGLTIAAMTILSYCEQVGLFKW